MHVCVCMYVLLKTCLGPALRVRSQEVRKFCFECKELKQVSQRLLSLLVESLLELQDINRLFRTNGPSSTKHFFVKSPVIYTPFIVMFARNK